jgi:hypothetical protein
LPTLGPLRGFLDATLKERIINKSIDGGWRFVKTKLTARQSLTAMLVEAGPAVATGIPLVPILLWQTWMPQRIVTSIGTRDTLFTSILMVEVSTRSLRTFPSAVV